MSFINRNIYIFISLMSVLLSGCVQESGLVHSHYNEGIQDQLITEQYRRQELEIQKQKLIDEISTLEEEIRGLNFKITQYEKKNIELHRNSEKTLSIRKREVSEQQNEVTRLMGEINKKKEMLLAKKRELEESFKMDV